MTTPTPHGLATVALLKARIDDRSDYLELFMPFVTDAIASIKQNNFTVADVQQIIQKKYDIAIPQYSLTVLLKRLDKRKLIKREAGVYINLNKIKPSGTEAKKQFIEKQNDLLADEFIKFAHQHKFQIKSRDEALELIINFLEDNKIAILLGSNSFESQNNKLSEKESKIVAEFVQNVIFHESNLTQIIKDILEGLVVYNTATLSDVNFASRNLKGLRVYLDTRFLFQLLGYEGNAQKTLAIETTDLLKKNGMQLLVFDKTIFEMKRILEFYEFHIGYSRGIKMISENVMGRHFLANRNTSSDIRQFSSLLTENLNRLGVVEDRMPKHVPQYTLDEKRLAEILADKSKGDEEEPRVVHDVSCAAAILTYRANNRSKNLVNTKFIFATSSYQVVQNIKRWYREEGEDSISPFIYIRSLTNTAWLKKPELSKNLKIHELVSLCQTVLQPSRKVWGMFLEHLNKLERSEEITSDEAVGIVVSDLTEGMLGELDDDVDVSSIDEIIERVRDDYRAEADKKIEVFKSESDLKITTAEFQAQQNVVDANKRADKANRSAQKIQQRLSERATNITKNLTLGVIATLYSVAIITALIAAFSQVKPLTVAGIILLFLTVIQSAVGWFGDLDYVNKIKAAIENFLLPRVRHFIGAEDNSKQHLSLLTSEDEDD